MDDTQSCQVIYKKKLNLDAYLTETFWRGYKKKLAEMQSCGFSCNACMNEAHQQVVPHTSQAIVITPVLPIEYMVAVGIYCYFHNDFPYL